MSGLPKLFYNNTFMKHLQVNWKQLAEKVNQRRSWLIGVWCILALILLVGVFSIGLRPIGGEERIVTIKEGQGRSSIASDLKDAGVIRSKIHFLLLAHALGAQMKPGVYNINPNQSTYAILHALRIGEFALAKITVPEGWRREQIAELLSKERFNDEEFLTLTKELEGMLFPDTYFLKKDITTKDIIAKFSENYEKRTSDLKPSKDQLTLASIVERESSGDTDRALIAGIYMNRIKQNMPLEADPTVQYAKYNNALTNGSPLDTFWPAITTEDYKSVESPFNTYLIPAYPPAPICNPGIKSIEAAISPSQTDALYFFHTEDGKIITSKTLVEHRTKVNQYL